MAKWAYRTSSWLYSLVVVANIHFFNSRKIPLAFWRGTSGNANYRVSLQSPLTTLYVRGRTSYFFSYIHIHTWSQFAFPYKCKTFTRLQCLDIQNKQNQKIWQQKRYCLKLCYRVSRALINVTLHTCNDLTSHSAAAKMARSCILMILSLFRKQRLKAAFRWNFWLTHKPAVFERKYFCRPHFAVFIVVTWLKLNFHDVFRHMEVIQRAWYLCCTL